MPEPPKLFKSKQIHFELKYYNSMQLRWKFLPEIFRTGNEILSKVDNGTGKKFSRKQLMNKYMKR